MGSPVVTSRFTSGRQSTARWSKHPRRSALAEIVALESKVENAARAPKGIVDDAVLFSRARTPVCQKLVLRARGAVGAEDQMATTMPTPGIVPRHRAGLDIARIGPRHGAIARRAATLSATRSSMGAR